MNVNNNKFYYNHIMLKNDLEQVEIELEKENMENSSLFNTKYEESVFNKTSKPEVNKNFFIKEKIETISNHILKVVFFENENQTQLTDRLQSLDKIINIKNENTSDNKQLQHQKNILKATIKENLLIQKLYRLTKNKNYCNNRLLNEYKTIVDEIKENTNDLTESQVTDVNENIKNVALRFIIKFSKEFSSKEVQESVILDYSVEQIEQIISLNQILEKIDEFFKINDTTKVKSVHPAKLPEILKFLIEMDNIIEKYQITDVAKKLYQALEIEKQIQMIREIEDNIKNTPEDFFDVLDQLVIDANIPLTKFYSIPFHRFYKIFCPPTDPLKLIRLLSSLNNNFDCSLLISLLQHLPQEMRTLGNIQSYIDFKPIINASIHENYKVRVLGFNKEYNNADQNAYSELMHRGVMLGAKIFKDTSALNIPWVFNEVIQFFSNYRQFIAVSLEATNHKDVGNLRKNVWGGGLAVTCCTGVYQDLGDKLEKILNETPPLGSPESGYTIIYSKSDEHPDGYTYDSYSRTELANYVDSSKAMITSFGTVKDADDKEIHIPLSKIIYYYLGDSILGRDVKVAVFHSNISNGILAMEHVSKLYLDILKKKKSL